MARATIGKELHFEAKDETGLLGVLTKTLALGGVYILHLSAYAVGKKARFQLVTRDPAKAKKLLKAIPSIGPHLIEREVLIVEFENKVGTLAHVARLLGSNDIGVRSVYGTSADGFKIVGVFSTEDDPKAAKIINDDPGTFAL